MVPAAAQKVVCVGDQSKRYLPQRPWALPLTAFIPSPKEFSEWDLFQHVLYICWVCTAEKIRTL
jgi:hypothetical protein